MLIYHYGYHKPQLWAHGNLVQSSPYRVLTRVGKKRVHNNLHAHAQNDAISPQKSGEKPYLEILSRFALWRDFLNNYTQTTISA